MKKCFKIAAVALLIAGAATGAQAQNKGDMAAGINLGLGAGDDITNFGLGAKFQYTIVDHLRAEGSFSYYFETDWVSMWDISANAHYLFGITDKLYVYPLAGLSLVGVTVDVSDIYDGWGGLAEAAGVDVDTRNTDTEFGFTLGGGADFALTEHFVLNAELKYRICTGTWSRFLVSVGAAYKF